MNKTETLKDRIADFIIDDLPHGSGIDCKYEIEFGKKIKIKNSYHAMNEYGYYIGYIDFYILLDLSADRWELHFTTNSAGYRFTRNSGLREYLEDLYVQFLG